MTAADLAALERLLAEATPGRWSHRSKLEDGTPCCDVIGDSDDDWSIVATGNPDLFDMRDADASLIVAAVNALPALIAAARARDGWQRAAESQNRQWSQKCKALTEERARCEELAAQLLATQQDRHRILMERDEMAAAARERDADLATIAQLQHEAADYATRMDKWRARYGEAAAERDALRAEVERMRAVVEAAREFKSVCEDWVACSAWESYIALRRALSALDAAKEGR